MGRLWREGSINIPFVAQRMSFRLPTLPMGLWEYDSLADKAQWEPAVYELHGLADGTPIDFDTWASTVAAQERDTAIRVCRDHLSRATIMEFSYRTSSGRSIALRGKVHRDRHGRVVAASGVTVDVSSIEEALCRAYTAAAEVADMLGADDADPDRPQELVRKIRDTLGGLSGEKIT